MLQAIKFLKKRAIMNVSDAINRRKSVRSFTGEAPSKAALDAILKAAEEAPVGMGTFENYRLTVVTNKQVLDAIDKAGAAFFSNPDNKPLYGAPVLVVVSAKKPEPPLANATFSSAACIVQNMALEAVEQGVGCCHIWGAIAGLAHDDNALASLLLPEGFAPCCGIALGVTDEAYEPRDIDQSRIARNIVE